MDHTMQFYIRQDDSFYTIFSAIGDPNLYSGKSRPLFTKHAPKKEQKI
jgi:hypothetical protein